MICDNPQCQHHVRMPAGMSPDAPRVAVVVPLGQGHERRAYGVPPSNSLGRVMVERYKYLDYIGSILFHLCGCCNTAVQMTKPR